MSHPRLDHIIILVPYADLINPTNWLGDLFTISPGGRHADNRTENRLILFRDGTYIELVAFIDDAPANRDGHWWDKPFGVVDWCLSRDVLDDETKTSSKGTTGSPGLRLDRGDFDHEEVQARLRASRTGIDYDPPVSGGRTKPDGTRLEWEVTFPRGVERMLLPFWCRDVSPREWRVPFRVDEAATTHQCRAVGLAGVEVHVRNGEVRAKVGKALGALFGTDGFTGGLSAPVEDGWGSRRGWRLVDMDQSLVAQDHETFIVINVLQLRAPQTGQGLPEAEGTYRMNDPNGIKAWLAFKLVPSIQEWRRNGVH